MTAPKVAPSRDAVDLSDMVDREAAKICALASFMRHTFYLMETTAGETHIRECLEGLAFVCELIEERSEHLRGSH